MGKLIVKDTEINISKINNEDYICITDMLKAKDGDFFVTDWLRNRNTLEYIGTWESIYNPDFNFEEFSQITSRAGLNNFKISVKEFVERTGAISITAKTGRYGGTYAHKDIAFEFAMWISPQFKIYIVKEFQRLKNEEQKQLGWSAKRELAKINYKIHTDAIKEHLITPELSPQEMTCTYTTEADILNVSLFGKTAAQWRNENNIKEKSVNIRDFASAEELVVLINLEDTNADLIKQGFSQIERLKILREKAYRQLEILKNNANTIETLKQNLIENKNQ